MAITTHETGYQNGSLNRPNQTNDQTHNKEVVLYTMLAGVLGGLFITVVMAAARAADLISLNLEQIFGALLLGTTGAAAWGLGLILHLAFSAIFALVYAEGFRRTHRANAIVGAAFGIVHWAAVGAFIGLLPTFRPALSDSLAASGPFAMNEGVFSFIFLLVVHLVFGAIIGVAYERTAQDHPEVLAPRG